MHQDPKRSNPIIRSFSGVVAKDAVIRSGQLEDLDELDLSSNAISISINAFGCHSRVIFIAGSSEVIWRK